MTTKLVIDNSINTLSLSEYTKYCMRAEDVKWLLEPCPSWYRFLAYMSSQLPDGSLVADLGTHIGTSAIALASNPKVHVDTYDVDDLVQKEYKECYKHLPNVTFHHGDCKSFLDQYLSASLICLDVAPHDGIQEREIIDALAAKDYKGIVICDDTVLFQGMQSFWLEVTQKKIDCTAWAHFSGTGVIIFDPDTIDLVIC